MLQRNPSGTAALGGRLGYSGITPSVAVFFDPARSLVSVYEDGVLTAISPTPLGMTFPGQTFTITYDACTHELGVTDDTNTCATAAECASPMNVPIDLESVLRGWTLAVAGVTASSMHSGMAATIIGSWSLSVPG